MKRLAIAVMLLIGCAGGSGWTKSAADTTCTDWTGTMTIDQRKALAAAELGRLWKADAAVSEPSAELVVKLANDLGSWCTSLPEDTIEVAVRWLYQDGQNLYKAFNQ